MSRAEVDLQISVKKACNSDETPPKRKHVRACIVYTWDHKNSRAFWNAVKIQPLQSDQIQLFKALIMIHKVLQEGHPNSLKDAYRNKDFISSLANVFPVNGTSYGRLILQYDKFILQKLEFHRANPGFNGTFEYEEYVSLRATVDPNEGYDSLLQLMDLQDHMDDFQKLIFATIHQTPSNLCKVSALVPLIAESYGIYKFCISMLRALDQQLGSDDFLADVVQRFESQHFMLRDFYTDCHAIKFLTSLVTIPRLPNTPPNFKSSDGDSISRPRSVQTQETFDSPPPGPPPLQPLPVEQIVSQQTGAFYLQEQQEQERIQQQLEQQRQYQLQQQLEQQRLFEEQQRQQEQRFAQEQQQLQQQALQAQQTHNQSRVSELENDLLMFKNQYDNDQQLLQQYDSRVKSLETELLNFNNTASQQIGSKDEQIRNLEDQIQNWTKKYETLAKLYSQLRQEHLNLLAKFKKIQQKINSAQESILKKEKFEKDLKSKNIELADLIRERDRARLDLDRVKAGKDQEIEKLQAEVRELNSHVNESGKLQSMNLSSILDKHQREMNDLKAQLKNGPDRSLDLEIAQESLESALKELELSKNDQDDIINAQIDTILLQNIEKMRNLIDVFLDNNIKRIQVSKQELSSSLQAGNLNSTPEYVLSIIEIASETATDFATIFNSFIADGKQTYEDEGSYSDIILSSANLTNSINELMLNVKGIIGKNIVKDDEEIEAVSQMYEILESTELYFLDLKSNSLNQLEDEDDKIDRVIDCNFQLQNSLQILSAFVEKLSHTAGLKNKSGNLEDIVNDEMEQTAKAVSSAFSFLENLLKDPKIKGGNFEVHSALLEASKMIIDAVILLIKSATESQREIVSRTKNSNQSRTEFYKKNSRWTEGLISASKAVAGATNVLIQTADGVLKESNSHEQLIVASNEVAALTAQLVAASRVKANFSSQTQDNLEISLNKVSNACKYLVSKVQGLLEKDQASQKDKNGNEIDLSKLTPYEGKTVEMEQQVEILKLENKLNSARKRLGEIRKHGYRDDNSDEES